MPVIVIISVDLREFEKKVAVEHNILRSLNAAQEAASAQYSLDDEFENADEDPQINDFELEYRRLISATKSSSALKVSMVGKFKKPVPNEQEKSALRDEIFILFEENRKEEGELVRLREKQASIFINFVTYFSRRRQSMKGYEQRIARKLNKLVNCYF